MTSWRGVNSRWCPILNASLQHVASSGLARLGAYWLPGSGLEFVSSDADPFLSDSMLKDPYSEADTHATRAYSLLTARCVSRIGQAIHTTFHDPPSCRARVG